MAKKFIGASLLSMAACLAAPATAQDTGAATARAAPEPLEDQVRGDPTDIIVTAQRREQSAQDVGIALSVVGQEELLQRGVTNVNQIANATPSLEVEPAFGGGQAQFRLRGVGFFDYAANNSPTVGVYVNEVAYPVPIMTQGLIFDMQRVEVLRGPQGTLYGRNTTGGAVNFITNKPTSSFSAGAIAEYGRFDNFYGEAFVSGPLTSGVSLRVAGATQLGGAYQKNRTTGEELGDAKRYGGRALLEIAPEGSGVSMLVDGHYGRDQSESTGLYLINPLRTRAGAGPTIPADRDHFNTGWGVSPTLVRDTELEPGDVPGVDNETWGASLNASFDFGPVTLTSITAYDRLDRLQFADWDATPSIEADTFFGSKVKVFSQEARLSNSQPGPLTWVLGAYYSKQKQTERYFSDFNEVYGTYARVNYAQEVESISGFGQAELQVAPTFKLIAGLRYEYEKRELQGFGSAFGGAQALRPTNVSTEMKPLTGKLGVEFKPNDQALFYATASRGAKSGGFTTYNTGDQTGIQPFKREILYAYEVGFKLNPSPLVQINASAFYYDYRDQQVLSVVFGATRNAVGKFVNAPKSRILGVDIEMTVRPIEGLTISQFFGYKEGKYVKFLDLNIPASRLSPVDIYVDKANQPIMFPKISYGGSVSYEIPAGEDFLITPSGTFSYRSKYPSWLGRTYDVDEYWLVNAEVAVGPRDGPWSVALWGRNIFNEGYDLTRNFFTSADIAQPGRPVSYGARVGFRF